MAGTACASLNLVLGYCSWHASSKQADGRFSSEIVSFFSNGASILLLRTKCIKDCEYQSDKETGPRFSGTQEPIESISPEFEKLRATKRALDLTGMDLT